MAEQIVNLPATPERIKSSSSSNGEKDLPHYLKPSTGSCHDHCKLGTTQNFLSKLKRPLRKKVVPAALDGEEEVDIVVLVDKKKKKVVLEESNPSSDSETLIAEPTKIVKREKKATAKVMPASSGSKTILPESTKVIKPEKKATTKLLPSSYSKTLSDESTKVIRREKKATVRAMPSSDSKALLAESTEVIEFEKKATPKATTSSAEPTKVVQPRNSSPSIIVGDSSKRVASKPLEKSLSAKVHSSSSSPKPIRVKLLSSPSSSSLRRNSIANSSSSPKPIRVKLLSSPSSSSLRRNSIANNGKDLDVLKTRAAYLPKSATVASSSSSDKVSGGSSGGRVTDVRTSIPRVAVKKILAPPKASLSPTTSVSRIPSFNARKTKSLKIVSPVKNQNKIRRFEPKQQSSSESIPEKTLHIIKMEPVNSVPTDTNPSVDTKSVLVVENSHPDENEARVSDTLNSADKETPVNPSPPSLLLEEIETLETNKNDVPLAESPPSSSLLSPESPPSSSPPSLLLSFESVIEKSGAEIDQTLETDENEVPLAESPPSSSLLSPESPPASSPPSLSISVESATEKSCLEKETTETVKDEKSVVEPPISSLLLSPESSSGSVSQSLASHNEEEEDFDGSDYTDSEAEEEHETETVEEKNNVRNGKARMVVSEDKKGNPVKLNFRRGKIIDLQHTQGNSPRKLRFRRGRVLGDNENGDAQKRSFKNREETARDGDGANLGSEKVVLKHQEVQGKKDLQGLFNNVIEQTVSRLTETRRSKVEALVGAFETVISLQDKKKSPAHHLAS